MLEKAKQSAAENGVTIITHMKQGHAGSEIVTLAEQEEIRPHHGRFPRKEQGRSPPYRQCQHLCRHPQQGHNHGGEIITEMIVKDYMTSDVVHVEIPGNRDDVLKILKRTGISGVPVIKNKKIVGIITRKDLLRKPEETQLGLLMTSKPVTIEPDMDVREAARLLVTQRSAGSRLSKTDIWSVSSRLLTSSMPSPR